MLWVSVMYGCLVDVFLEEVCSVECCGSGVDFYWVCVVCIVVG